MLPIDISKIRALMFVFVARKGTQSVGDTRTQKAWIDRSYGRVFNIVGLKLPARTSVREGQEAAEGCEQRRLGCCGWNKWVRACPRAAS